MTNRRNCLIRVSALACSAALPFKSFAAQKFAIGLSLPVSGGQSEVAKDLLAGYDLALKSRASDLQLRVLDDAGLEANTAKNVATFADDPSVICLSGLVGTPHAQAALPVAIKQNLPVVGIRSGASMLRAGQEGVYHLRASFEDELDKIANTSAGAGITKMAIIYANDSFGKGSNDYLGRKLASLGITVLSANPVERNGEKMEVAITKIADEIKASKAGVAVALLMIAKPAIEAVKQLRKNHQIMMPIYAMSFVSTRSVMTSTDPLLAGMGLVAVFPHGRYLSNGLAIQFQADIKKFNKDELVESITALEGYFYGSVIAIAAAQSKSRSDLVKRLNAGVSFADRKINFDDKKVGFHYLAVLRKTSGDGKFRA